MDYMMIDSDLTQIKPLPKPKRHRKEWVYKSEYDKVVAERERWKRAFRLSTGLLLVLAIVRIIFGLKSLK